MLASGVTSCTETGGRAGGGVGRGDGKRGSESWSERGRRSALGGRTISGSYEVRTGEVATVYVEGGETGRYSLWGGMCCLGCGKNTGQYELRDGMDPPGEYDIGGRVSTGEYGIGGGYGLGGERGTGEYRLGGGMGTGECGPEGWMGTEKSGPGDWMDTGEDDLGVWIGTGEYGLEV